MADEQRTPKLCECGCGRETSLAKRNDPKTGAIKGQPNRFVYSHRPALPSPDQRKWYASRSSAGNRYVHRQRAEKALGKPLPLGAEVHHPDEDPWNEQARLVICQDHAYHYLLHARMRVKAAGGDPNTQRICGMCKAILPLSEFDRRINRGRPGFNYACRSCYKPYKAEYDRTHPRPRWRAKEQ
jgi:hypothetical protein